MRLTVRRETGDRIWRCTRDLTFILSCQSAATTQPAVPRTSPPADRCNLHLLRSTNSLFALLPAIRSGGPQEHPVHSKSCNLFPEEGACRLPELGQQWPSISVPGCCCLNLILRVHSFPLKESACSAFHHWELLLCFSIYV